MKALLAASAALIALSGWAAAQAPAAAPAKPVAALAAKPAVAKAPAKKAAKPAPAVEEAPAESAPVVLEPLAASLQAYAQFQADIDAVNGGSIQDSKDLE